MLIRTLGALALLASTASAQTVGPRTYLYLTATDTVLLETVAITDSAVNGVQRTKDGSRVQWTQARQGMTMGALGIRVFAAGVAEDGVPTQQFTIRTVGDSVIADITTGGNTQTQRGPGKAGAIPLLNQSLLHVALLAIRADRMRLATFDVLLARGGAVVPVRVTRAGDTLAVTLASQELRIVVDASGLPRDILAPGLHVVASTGPAPTLTPSAPAPKPTYDAPAGAPYTAEHVRIPTSRGYMLAGTLTRPRTAPGVRVPVVVTISGSGPEERDSRLPMVKDYAVFRDLADTLGRRGIATLRYDDRGTGESGGNYAVATSADLADDVRSVVAWLRTRADLDPARVALAGHSEGGMIAPMVAATDARLRAVALLAGPAYSGRRILRYQLSGVMETAGGRMTAPADSAVPAVDAQITSIAASSPWAKYFIEYDPLPTLAKVRQPVLVLQGETDHQITPEQAEVIAAALRRGGNTRVTVRTLPAINHLLLRDPSGKGSGYTMLTDVRVAPEVRGVLADWLAGVLR